MQAIPTEIKDVLLIVPKKHGDHRGFFSETYSRRDFTRAGIDLEFIQDNHSLSVEKGVLRGLHYQIPPRAQDKLIRVVRGSILDVAVDIRRGSPTLGKVVTAILSAENWHQFFVPRGFAHGFVTLEANTEVVYKVTDYYSPEHERGILWSDPDLGIDWQVLPSEVVLSQRDTQHPLFADADLGANW
ncbi:dTDP-4-dehydrorhamnose 3,5-epimerase [bacterium]|jgi:dTDP-4-dehydrorhamnose 3,5-epimerase|nr:dTDP-4-dehydrorhamnose 3,5-epimerase [bacterium]